MPPITASAERDIAAPADRLYRIIADYQRHHPHILPPQVTDLIVEEGGVGAGTIIRFNVTLAGSTRTNRARIEEPEPGRVLVEQDLESDLATTFTVTPAGDGSRVRIETAWTPSGLRGFIEKLMAPRMLRRVYIEELALLERYAQQHADA